jgi:hypothetical protein
MREYKIKKLKNKAKKLINFFALFYLLRPSAKALCPRYATSVAIAPGRRGAFA